MAETYLRRSQVPNYIESHFGFPCAKATLAKLASTGGGPQFFKAGRFPVYMAKDVDDWCRARLGKKRGSAPAELLVRRVTDDR